MNSKSGWKWYGFAGHFICGSRCQYHLATNINNKYLVSTVGKFVPDPLHFPNNIDTIGAGKDDYFETYVFNIDGEDEHGNPNVKEYLEISGQRKRS